MLPALEKSQKEVFPLAFGYFSGFFAFLVQQIEKGFQLNFVTESVHIKKKQVTNPITD